MKMNIYRACVCFLLLSATSLALPGAADDARELESKIQQLTQLRLEIQQQRSDATIAKQNFENRRQQLQTQLKASELQFSELKQQQQALNNRVELVSAEIAKAESAHKELIGVLEAQTQQLKELVVNGLNFQKQQRLTVLDKFLGQLKEATLNSDFTDTFQWFQTEVQRSFSSETWSAPVALEKGQRRIEADHFRLGLVCEGYIAESGDRAQVTAAQNMSQPLTLEQSNIEKLQQLKTLVESLSGRSTPALSALPLPVLPASSLKAGGQK